MFKKLFKRKSEKEKLQQRYMEMQQEIFKLAKTDRKSADLLQAKAEEVLKAIEAL